MGNILRADLRRISTSWRLYVAILGSLALALHPVLLGWQDWAGSTPLTLFSLAMGMSDFTPHAAIFAVLPYAASFSTDWREGYAPAIVSRVGFRRYAWGRWASVALSGALAMGAMMAGVVAVCWTAAGQPDTAETAYFLDGGNWAVGNLPLAMGGLWFCLLRILLAMLFGSLWATVGLICGALLPSSRYLALVLPFLVYQGLWFLAGDTLLNPVYYFRADMQAIPSLAFAFGWQILWNAAVAALAQFLMLRRLRT